jgi:molybdopterin converting factor small subunit
MSKTVTFVVKQTLAKKLAVADGTTVRRLRNLVADMGYDVLGDDTHIRIVRDGVARIGHIKDEPLRRNDIVVFESEGVRLQVSPEVAATKTYAPKQARPVKVSGCSPECCEDRFETFKREVLSAINNLAQSVANF